MKWVYFLSIASFTLLTPIAGNAVEPDITTAPLDKTISPKDGLDIAEAVFRYQFTNNASGQQQKAATYFLLLFGGNPDADFLNRFSGNLPPVKAGADFIIGTGLQFEVARIKRISDSVVEVEGGYYETGLSASGNTYRVEHIDGKWTVTRNQMNWIS